MMEVVLFSAPGCCLCDRVRVVLQQLSHKQGFNVTERDITLDDQLHRTYLERIPVIAIDGVEEFELLTDEKQLRDRLQKQFRKCC
jgi:hypothetical protein